ncbi:polysaccharide pyruvyl transferase family protein [Neobacillus cucumis]|uniref:polysaccharide pyruvyl transferase family protein n=1 Tax=Neobacillus cucumis TaxID=1740721 RepID=UPI00196518FD|nr:polysaccharide pyruvyl transferase family protein [Neobacillus cucumis]MBM7651853.1 colanic acid/amylovoran biosynthesis protein [Neobacillus cucumis]
MKKIFVDIYLMFNLGDDLFLDILAKKYPNCQFTINYLGNNYDEFISHYKNVNRRKYTFLNKICQKLKVYNTITNYKNIAETHDALLFIGGSIFREEEYHHTLYEDRMKLVKEFKDRHKPIFILGANFGPFKNQEFFYDYKDLFQICDDVCFRDLYSYNLFKDLSHVRYAPDIVFQMDLKEYQNIPHKNRVGFSIIDLGHKNGLSKYNHKYIKSTVKTIELLVKSGYECYLMSFCEHEGDTKVIKRILSILSRATIKKVKIYEYKGNLKEAISLMATFKMVVAARFHANIISFLLGIGVMPVIYSEKTTNMLKDIKLDKIKIGMKNINLQYDEDIVREAFNNKTNLETIKHRAKDQFNKLDDFLGAYQVSEY